jgi:hypothetical protein
MHHAVDREPPRKWKNFASVGSNQDLIAIGAMAEPARFIQAGATGGNLTIVNHTDSSQETLVFAANQLREGYFRSLIASGTTLANFSVGW